MIFLKTLFSLRGGGGRGSFSTDNNYLYKSYSVKATVGVYTVLIKTISNFIYCLIHYQDSVGWTGLQSFDLVQK